MFIKIRDFAYFGFCDLLKKAAWVNNVVPSLISDRYCKLNVFVEEFLEIGGKILQNVANF